MKELILLSKKEILERIWQREPKFKGILDEYKDIEEARFAFFDYLNRLERDVYNMQSGTDFEGLNIVEKRNVRECIRVLANTFRTENEQATNCSPFALFYELARNEEKALEEVSKGFLVEYLTIFQGIRTEHGKHYQYHALMESHKGRTAAIERSSQLDEYAEMIQKYFKRYRSGLDEEFVEKRERLKGKILDFFGANEEDWFDYKWHLKHIIKDIKTLGSIVTLSEDEIAGLEIATKGHIPFEITPYYLSLFNQDGLSDQDRAVRAQVIPSLRYARNVVENWDSGKSMDFMEEESTSPIDGVTRRYPEIIIMKPFNSCPQICVYCQRNWEIKDIHADVMLPKKKVLAILDWVREHKGITEVLITGGDPLTLNNQYLDWLMGELASMGHLDRIRIGTRIPVTLPMRFDDGLLEIFKKYHEWGKREVSIVTHFEHPSELSLETLDAMKKIKNLGMNIYNQQVFTYYNSRKFETAFLRKVLKIVGIDPYYSFNCQGKEETIDFRVPIARIEQERKEEARLLPGLVRTDEPVFNVPRLGKSHLRAWQDHEVVMILPDGKRIYRFYSWETQLTSSKDFLYTDVSIYDYLKRLLDDGENIDEYISIWYYF